MKNKVIKLIIAILLASSFLSLAAAKNSGVQPYRCPKFMDCSFAG